MPDAEAKTWLTKLLVIVVLVVVSIVAYWPVQHNGYVRLDDYDYVARNQIVQQGLTIDGVRWAFRTTDFGNWHPLTWLSHMVDCAVFGADRPAWHHWENVAWHILNSALIFSLLATMTSSVWRPALVAALFCVHPTHVESVAWIAERKDLLSVFFGLLAIAAYVRFVQSRSVLMYGLVMASFALSLMAKPMLVTLPCVLLLLDYWPLQRTSVQRAARGHSIGRLFIEKLPLFGMSMASSVVAYVAQQSAGAMARADQLGLGARMANAVISYARYILKTLWPADLALQYPLRPNWPIELVLLAAMVVLAVTIGVLLYAQRSKFLAVGWLWFLGTLVPVIGLVQVGSQSMADRYTYFPSIGLYIMIAWGFAVLARQRVPAHVAAACWMAAIAGLAWATHQRVKVWRDTIVLFEDSIAKAGGNNPYIEYLLGLELRVRGDIEAALPHLQKYAAFRPSDEHVRLQLDEVQTLSTIQRLLREGQSRDALPHLQHYTTLRPDDAMGFALLGSSLVVSGQQRDAAAAYQRAFELDPALSLPSALNNYAVILSSSADESIRNGPLAVKLSTRACELTKFEHAAYLFTLAACHAETGDFEMAVSTAERALNIARSTNQTALAQSIEDRIDEFRKGKPSRDIFDSTDQAPPPNEVGPAPAKPGM